MEPITLLILGGTTAAALSLLEEQKQEASHIYKEYDGVPRHVMIILETFDRTHNFTSGASRAKYANHLWNYYDLENLTWKPSRPQIHWHAGVHEDVMSSHTFFIPFEQAISIERKIKNPQHHANKQQLMQSIGKYATTMMQNQPGYAESGINAISRIRTAADWLIDNYSYNFQRIVFRADYSADIQYQCYWRQNASIPDNLVNGSLGYTMGVTDLCYAFMSLIDCADGNNKDAGVISYGLMAQKLYEDFFHCFIGHEDENWESKYLNKEINFPKFPTVKNEGLGWGDQWSGITSGGAHLKVDYRFNWIDAIRSIFNQSLQFQEPLPVGTDYLDVLAKYRKGSIQNFIKNNLRQNCKDLFTAWCPNIQDAPMPFYSINELKEGLPLQYQIESIFPAWPFTYAEYRINIFNFGQEFQKYPEIDKQLGLFPFIIKYIEDDNRHVVPVKDWPESYPDINYVDVYDNAQMQSYRAQVNRINGYRKYFNWYFLHNIQYLPNQCPVDLFNFGPNEREYLKKGVYLMPDGTSYNACAWDPGFACKMTFSLIVDPIVGAPGNWWKTFKGWFQ